MAFKIGLITTSFEPIYERHDINSILCSMCNSGMESNEHLFCSCEVVVNVWRLIRLWCDAQLPVFNSVTEGFDWIYHM